MKASWKGKWKREKSLYYSQSWTQDLQISRPALWHHSCAAIATPNQISSWKPPLCTLYNCSHSKSIFPLFHISPKTFFWSARSRRMGLNWCTILAGMLLGQYQLMRAITAPSSLHYYGAFYNCQKHASLGYKTSQLMANILGCDYQKLFSLSTNIS